MNPTLDSIHDLKPIQMLIKAKTEILIDLELEYEFKPNQHPLQNELRARIEKTRGQINKLKTLVSEIEANHRAQQEKTALESKQIEDLRVEDFVPSVVPASACEPTSSYETDVAVPAKNRWTTVAVAAFTALALTLIFVVKEYRDLQSANRELSSVKGVHLLEYSTQLDASQAFNTNSSELNEAFTSALDRSVERLALGGKAKVRVEVSGVPSPGNEQSPSAMKFLKQLTQKRAERIKDYLKDRYGSQLEITAVGTGYDLENPTPLVKLSGIASL